MYDAVGVETWNPATSTSQPRLSSFTGKQAGVLHVAKVLSMGKRYFLPEENVA